MIRSEVKKIQTFLIPSPPPLTGVTSGEHLGISWGFLTTFFFKQFLHSTSALHQIVSFMETNDIYDIPVNSLDAKGDITDFTSSISLPVKSSHLHL